MMQPHIADEALPREALLKMDGSAAYEWRLADLRTELANATTRSEKNTLRRIGRQVLANYRNAFPHLQD